MLSHPKSKTKFTELIFFRTIHEKEKWVKSINTAYEEYVAKKESFETGTDEARIVTDRARRRSLVQLGDVAVPWIPAERVTMCMLCNTVFSFVVRKHHCRACGKVFCGRCTNNKAPLKFRNNEAAKVCDTCVVILRESK